MLATVDPVAALRRRLVGDRQHDRQDAVLEASPSALAGRRPRPGAPGAGTRRTRSPSAGRPGPARGAACARRRHEHPLAGDDRTLPGRRRAARRRSSARADRRCGSSRRSAGTRAAAPAKRGTCQRSANSSSISPWSLSSSRPCDRERYPRPAPSGGSLKTPPWERSGPAGPPGRICSTRAASRCSSARPPRCSSFFSGHYGTARSPLLSLVVFVGFAFVARVAAARREHPIAAGLFAFVSVPLFGAFVACALDVVRLARHVGGARRLRAGSRSRGCSLVLLTLLAALIALRSFRFPLLVLTVVGLTWFFVTDLLSGGGDWSAVVTFVVGLVFLGWARARRQRPEPLRTGCGCTSAPA